MMKTKDDKPMMDNKPMLQAKEHNLARDVLPLTSDLVFKAVFGRDTGESKAALIALLNLILEQSEKPIRDLVLKNPFIYAELPTKKQVILDIKAELSTGEWIDIEMQVENVPFYLKRILYYAAKLLAEQLESGDNYGNIKKTIVITLTCVDHFPLTDKVHTQFHLREDTEGFLMTDHLEFLFLYSRKRCSLLYKNGVCRGESPRRPKEGAQPVLICAMRRSRERRSSSPNSCPVKRRQLIWRRMY